MSKIFIDEHEFINDSDWNIILDCGHSGLIDGVYDTAPKKMYDHGEFIFYEGVFNRKIGVKLAKLLKQDEISYVFTTNSNYDISLNVRVIHANNIKRLYFDKKHLFLSIHANAAPIGSESATGIEVFTSKGNTDADPMADVFFKHLGEIGWKMRKDYRDGDFDKEANFYVLKYTLMPAVLVELGFYTNYEEAKLMMQEEIQDKLVQCLYEAIKEIIKSEENE